MTNKLRHPATVSAVNGNNDGRNTTINMIKGYCAVGVPVRNSVNVVVFTLTLRCAFVIAVSG